MKLFRPGKLGLLYKSGHLYTMTDWNNNWSDYNGRWNKAATIDKTFLDAEKQKSVLKILESILGPRESILNYYVRYNNKL